MKTRILFSDVGELSKEEIWNREFSSATEYRKQKINRIKHEGEKRLSLGVEILLREALKEEKINLEDLSIQLDENGKPFFENHPEINFNLSHSGTKVLCIISEKKVGCDVETVKDINLMIAKKFFAKSENDLILNSENKTDLFYKIWTLKESFIKTTGLGIKQKLNSFSFYFDNSQIKINQNFDNNKYYFGTVDIENCKASFCIQNYDGEEIIIREISIK